MFSVTVLGGSGNYVRNPTLRSVRAGGCVTIQEQPADCDGKSAWYRVTKEEPTSDGCSKGRRRSENGEFCLATLHPVDVDIDVDIPPLSTPDG